MAPLSESQLLRFLLEVAALLLVSRMLAEVAKRFDQAPVIGELLAGILLGKSVLGHLAPPLYAIVTRSCSRPTPERRIALSNKESALARGPPMD